MLPSVAQPPLPLQEFLPLQPLSPLLQPPWPLQAFCPLHAWVPLSAIVTTDVPALPMVVGAPLLDARACIA